MHNQAEIDLSYRFSSSVIFPNGRQSELRKTESVKIQKRSKGGMNICLLGFCEERLNTKPLTDFDEIISTLGKSLYPVILNVKENAKIENVLNFEEIKSRWHNACNEIRNKYENAYIIERYINTSSENLRNEELLLQALKSNTFIQLLFWNREEQNACVTVADFPLREERITLCFDKKEQDSNYEVYRSSSIVYSENEITLNGDAVLKVKRTEGTFPESVSLAVRVEVQGEGYYTKRVNIELIKP